MELPHDSLKLMRTLANSLLGSSRAASSYLPRPTHPTPASPEAPIVTSSSTPSRTVRLVAELGVVILGVMIALAGDSWREGYLESQVAEEYEMRLAEEVSQTVTGIRSVRDRFTASRVAAGSLTGVPGSSSRSGDPVADLLAAAAMGLDREELGPDATYQEMVATGHLTLIQGDVRRGVIAHYDRMERLWRLLQELPRLHDYVAQLTGYLPIEFLAHGQPLTERVAARLAEAIETDPALQQQLGQLHAHLIFADRLFDETLSGAQRLLNDLQD